jgi:protein-tyrosine phosphatase
MRAELFRIERADAGDSGALSIMARPRGGDWLADEIAGWQTVGVGVVVSLLTPEEQAALGLEDEVALCAQRQMTFWSFPIPDRALPQDRAAAERLVEQIVTALKRGEHVAVHCRMGIGRSALVAAAALVAFGNTPQDAFARIEAARGRPVPDTLAQRQWVEDFAVRRDAQ